MKVVVGKVSDFGNGDRKIIDVNGKSVGVFRIDDQFYALRNRCPQQFGPLCLGTLAPRAMSDGPGDVRMDSGPPLLACPWHGWEYDLATGQSFMGPGAEGNQARPDGRVPGPYVDIAILIPLTFVLEGPAAYKAALCRAINDWLVEEWLDRDPRLRGSINVPFDSPDLAVAEIERFADDPRFVQVMVRGDTQSEWGDRKYWPIYQAAEAAGAACLAAHAG